jgi:hypothetical protein
MELGVTNMWMEFYSFFDSKSCKAMLGVVDIDARANDCVLWALTMSLSYAYCCRTHAQARPHLEWPVAKKEDIKSVCMCSC